MVVAPSCVFPYKAVEHAHMWKSHQREMDDQFISLWAFQVATTAYTFLVPLLSVICAQPILYGILKWNYGTFLSQLTISALQVLVSLELGRAIMVWFRGEFTKGVRVYTVYLLFALTFNGIIINPMTLPLSLRWLFTLSHNFWALGGSIMLHFDPAYYSDLESCTDMVNCLLQDGNVIV